MTGVAGRWNLRVLAVALAAAYAVAGIGGALTEIGPWYYALKKPWWQPPDWAFGPAWMVIFTVTAIAGHHAWLAVGDRAGRAALLALFGINAALNVAWSWLFFTLRRPDWALVEVGFFWLSIVVLIAFVGRRSRAAAYLLGPYLAWVSFAAYLNRTVAELNAPFH